MTEPPEISSKRLLLRAFRNDDAGRVRELAGNWAVARYTQNVPHPYAAGVAESWIATHVDLWHRRVEANFAITLADSETLIGAIGLRMPHSDKPELGYWVGEAFWGQGYASEAAAALIEYAFANWDVAVIYARHLPQNSASGRVMIKAGMARIGTVDDTDRHGQTVAMDNYAIRRA